MKKIFAFVAATVLFAGIANAQLGVNVGYAPQTYTQVYTNGNNSSTDNLELNGFFGGVNYNMPVSGDLNVSLGVQFRFNTKTTESNAGVGTLLTYNGKTEMTQMLLDIPILFNYGLKLTGELKIGAFAGPTVSYALSGNSHVTTSGSVAGLGGSGESDYPWYGDNGDWKNLELGGTVGVFATMNSIRLFGGYNMGLLNIDKRDNYSTKGSNIFFGVGYAL